MFESLMPWFARGGAVIGLCYGVYRLRRDKHIIPSSFFGTSGYLLVWVAAGVLAGLAVLALADSVQKLAADGCMPLLG